jgi:hypothetical protein
VRHRALGAQRGVHRQDQRGVRNGLVARFHRAQHREREGRERQPGDEQPRQPEGRLHRERDGAEANQRDQLRAQPAAPAVVGLGQRAGDGAQEQRDHRIGMAGGTAQRHEAAEGEKNAHGLRA